MSDKIEIVAAASVNVVPATPGTPRSVAFLANRGFDAIASGSPGAYDLTLEHEHDADQLVVLVSRNSTTSGDISASVVGTGDTKSIRVTSLPNDEPADTSFYIEVLRVRS